MWINLKTSRLSRFSRLSQLIFLLAYGALAWLLLTQPSFYINWLLAPLIAQAAWAWRLTWGKLAPAKLLLNLQTNQLTAFLNNQQQEDWQPPALVFNRWLLVFSRPGWLRWPWLVWPGSITPEEHQRLRRFLRSWH